MNSRFLRFAIIIVLLLLAAEVAQPYVTRLMFAQTTPRPIAARGDMSDIERSFIELFQRISPSVVQIAGQQDGAGLPNDESEGGGGVQSGTGFIWDAAGNIVTNNHVLAGTSNTVVRLATGNILSADIVGTAPNYDLAVIRLHDPSNVPPPIPIGSSAM